LKAVAIEVLQICIFEEHLTSLESRGNSIDFKIKILLEITEANQYLIL
jgi:hypothetical protein